MSVSVERVVKSFGGLVAVNGISFEVRTGAIVSLLGPSGCGKTTTLRLIAGFETPDEGHISIAGVDMAGKRPYERNVGLLFQDYALFPHMTVEENVAYGLRHRGFRRSEIPARTSEMLALVRLRGLESRRPNQLSGGQQQRVALARALAVNPNVMLLDEPLSALDAKLRQELRVELREILTSVGTTSIVVTHDQEEAMSLAEHIIVMNQGEIMQQGTPSEIYNRPSNKFVAEFIGRSNWFEGRLGGEPRPGLRVFVTNDGYQINVSAASQSLQGKWELCLRPERIGLVWGRITDDTQQSDCNVLPGRILEAVHLGPFVHRFVQLDSGRRVALIEKHCGQALGRTGDQVVLVFQPEDCILVPSDTSA